MLGAVRPTRAQLVAEIGDVVHDFPAFATAPLFRSWHLRWGATPDADPWRHPATALFGALLMEFGDFAMQRRMLRGIKTRAESGAT